jgi:hypothetical protein
MKPLLPADLLPFEHPNSRICPRATGRFRSPTSFAALDHFFRQQVRIVIRPSVRRMMQIKKLSNLK